MSRIHAMDGEVPAGPGLFEVNGHDPQKKLITNVRRIAGAERTPGSLLIGISTGLLALLGAGCFYVSWWGQYLFIFAAKQQAVPAQIQAGMLDAGMVILSGLSLGLARQGKPSRAERVLIQLCAAGSAAMNYLAADDASPRSVIVFTAAPIFAAIITDRVVSVVRRHALGISEESAWRGLGRAVAGLARVTGLLALYWLRFVLAPGETASGVRRMVLDAAPLPGVAAVMAGPVTGRGTVPIAPVPDEEHQPGRGAARVRLQAGGVRVALPAAPAVRGPGRDEPGGAPGRGAGGLAVGHRPDLRRRDPGRRRDLRRDGRGPDEDEEAQR